MKNYFKWIKTLIKKHKNTNKVVSFTKEFDGKWYVDFPEWSLSHHNLMMVAGADDFLDFLDVMRFNHVKLNVTTSKTKREHKKYEYEFVKQSSNLLTGATYVVNTVRNDWDKDKTVWLCPVTLSVLGEYPDYMYVSEIPYNY